MNQRPSNEIEPKKWLSFLWIQIKRKENNTNETMMLANLQASWCKEGKEGTWRRDQHEEMSPIGLFIRTNRNRFFSESVVTGHFKDRILTGSFQNHSNRSFSRPPYFHTKITRFLFFDSLFSCLLFVFVPKLFHLG